MSLFVRLSGMPGFYEGFIDSIDALYLRGVAMNIPAIDR
jgi:hypothetical protein